MSALNCGPHFELVAGGCGCGCSSSGRYHQRQWQTTGGICRTRIAHARCVPIFALEQSHHHRVFKEGKEEVAMRCDADRIQCNRAGMPIHFAKSIERLHKAHIGDVQARANKCGCRMSCSICRHFSKCSMLVLDCNVGNV